MAFEYGSDRWWCGFTQERTQLQDQGKICLFCTGLFEMADYQTYQGCLTNTILKLIPMAMGENKDLARMISMHEMDTALNLLLD